MADSKKKEKTAEQKTQKSTPLAAVLVTPVLVFAICAAITAVAGVKPYNKFETYLNVAFSDSMKTTVSAADSIVVSGDIDTFEMAPDTRTSSTGKVVYPSFGEQYAMLSCESVNLYVPVYWGSSEELLKNGACQLTASAVAGDKGNTVIDAHVNTFFEHLQDVKEGDIVKINTSYGEFTYKVKTIAEFAKTDKRYVSQDKTDKLTLYTCVKQLLGSSDQRLAVVCEPVESKFYN